jgi:hypothetical protein
MRHHIGGATDIDKKTMLSSIRKQEIIISIRFEQLLQNVSV